MVDLLSVDQVVARVVARAVARVVVMADLLSVDQPAVRVVEVHRLEMTSDHHHPMISTMIFRFRQPTIEI